MQIGHYPRGNALLSCEKSMLTFTGQFGTARGSMTKKPKTTKPGVVQKIIEPRVPHQPEMAEIAIEGAEHLYREIRIENALEDEKGQSVKLKPGAQVEVTVEADPKETAPALSVTKE
jgi:hypothetical protein